MVGGGSVKAVVQSGGLSDVAFGTASGTTLSGGAQMVSGGGLAVYTAVLSGGTETVGAQGTDKYSQVTTGGYEYVQSGGVSISATVTSDGNMDVQSGGHAFGTMVSSDSDVEVDYGGSIRGAKLNFGFITLYGGTATQHHAEPRVYLRDRRQPRL